MNKIVAVALMAAATGYTLIIVFMVVFTFGFFGFQGMGNNLIGLVIFCLLAVSPLAVWPYCLSRSKAWLRGEHPPF